MNLAALLFDVARRLPERPAVSDERHAWTYRELAERVARLAGGLRARGLQPGDRVLLSLENCGEFFELLLGCWASGLCAVPANARLHPREVEYIAANSGARLLVATPGLAEALAPLAGSVNSLKAVISTRTAAYDSLLTSAPPLRPEPGMPTDRASLFLAPTMLTRLVHAPETAGADLANLKTIYYGGGPMYVADLEEALGLFGPRLYQLYGQGESPMTITGLPQRMHADAADPHWRERLGSCGVPRTGVLVRVVDDNDEELPSGEVG